MKGGDRRRKKSRTIRKMKKRKRSKKRRRQRERSVRSETRFSRFSLKASKHHQAKWKKTHTNAHTRHVTPVSFLSQGVTASCR